MSLRFPSVLVLLVANFVLAQAPATQRTVLRVAADPNNLPFSNEKGEGLENRLAELIAADLGLKVEYVWHAQRRGFFRETLKEGDADVVMGVPAHFDRALTTSPYYRSTYVFVTRQTSGIHVSSFDDALLRRVKVGVHLTGEDNPPPAQALGRRNIFANVSGYSLYGNYAEPNPPARIIDAVAHGDIDIAIVWGPLAGYFAKQSAVPLNVNPVSPQIDTPNLPMAFSVSVGVRKRDAALRDQIDQVLHRRQVEVRKLLEEYGVPIVAGEDHPARDDDDDDERVKSAGCCE
jgi:mxaJ protein